MSAHQMTFIQNIITYLSKNGTIDKRMLFQAPFTDSHDQGLFGIFDDAQAGKIISIIEGINENAEVGWCLLTLYWNQKEKEPIKLMIDSL